MPGKNRKGPRGEGPQTGRGLGKCNENQVERTETESQPGGGRGLGRGPRRGMGRGQGQGQGRGLGRRAGGWGSGRGGGR